MSDVKFKLVKDEEQVYELIDQYEQFLIPALRDRGINIKDYAHKLCQYGQTYSVRLGLKAIGCASIYANDLKKRTGYLSFIAIDPEYRGMGVGKRFLVFLENKSRESGMEHLSLEVHTENKNSIAFYRHCGYQPSDNTDADSFHMVKDL